MPNYFPIVLRQSFGLSLKQREDAIPPGKSVVCDNVDHSRRTIRKRPGKRAFLKGTFDGVKRGGPPGPSLYVQGYQYWLEHERLTRDITSHEYRDEEFHHRQGCISMPEGELLGWRFNPTQAIEWFFDFTLWTDDLTTRAIDPEDLTNSDYYPIVVMAKSDLDNTQWDIQIKPEVAGITGRTRFYVSLTIYKSALHTQGESFEYRVTPGGPPASYFDVGKRHWFGFHLVNPDSDAPGIQSWYWQEGMSAAVVSSQSMSAGLKTAGNQAGAVHSWPIVVGRRPRRRVDSPRNLEVGFNGCVGELRLWLPQDGQKTLANINSLLGMVKSNWFWEREMSDEDIDSYSYHNDLALYYSFDPRLQDPNDARWLQPRYPDPKFFTDRGLDKEAFRAWLTGADAVWVPGSGVLGKFALAFLPSCCVTGQETAFYRSLAEPTEIFAGGIRIPNGNLYVNRITHDTPEWSKEYTFRITIRPDFLNLTIGGHDHTLMFLGRVRKGSTQITAHHYSVTHAYLIALFWDGAKWVVRATVLNPGGADTVVTGTTAISPEATTNYVIEVTARDGTGERVVSIYLNGFLEATSGKVTATVPNISTPTASDVTSPNLNSEDGRGFEYPFYLGCQVQTQSATAPNPYLMRYGAPFEVGYRGVNPPPTSGTQDTAPARLRWAFFSDATRATERGTHFRNAGVGYRGYKGLRGVIGDFHVWKQVLTEAELKTFGTRPPNAQEISAYGARLLSAYDMEEGMENLLFDRGNLGNHIRFNPFPKVLPVSGPIGRYEKGQIYGFWEIHTSTPREGTSGKDIYLLTDGSVARVLENDNGERYVEPISGRIPTFRDEPPTAFKFSDFTYLCPGVGPVLRISRKAVTVAGLSPIQGEIQGEELGWAEVDRDGTFMVQQTPTTVLEDVLFPVGSTWVWAVTCFDQNSGVESVASRLIYYTVEAVDSGFNPDANVKGATGINLAYLPRPRERHVTHFRIYRSAADVQTLQFVDQIPINTYIYTDKRLDEELGEQLNTSLHYPPPQNARLGITNGRRAFYAGMWGQKGTIFPSLAGFPEYCPPAYAITPVPQSDNEITGMLSLQARMLVFMDNSTFILNDQGFDIALNTLSSELPFTIEELWSDVGCVSQHSIQMIDTIGAVFAGERGIYVSDGSSYRYVSSDIEPFYSSLDFSTRRKWHSVHNARARAYILFVAEKGTNGKLNRAIVWQYDQVSPTAPTGEFTTLTISARCSGIVNDSSTGTDRILIADYYGELWEYDSPDADSSDDGASSLGLNFITGTIPSDAFSTASKIALYEEGGPILPTTADGLRGVTLTLKVVIGTQEFAETRTILRNDERYVWVDSAFSQRPPPGIEWQIGRVVMDWRSGKIGLGDEQRLARVKALVVNWEARNGNVCDLEVSLGGPVPGRLADANSAGDYTRFGRITGRGSHMQIALRDDAPRSRSEATVLQLDVLSSGSEKWRA